MEKFSPSEASSVRVWEDEDEDGEDNENGINDADGGNNSDGENELGGHIKMVMTLV